MTIQEIYSTYQIPPNLSRHMLEVAAVGSYVCDYWRGEPIDRVLIEHTLLLHDMGNIIKFKRPFLGELEKDSTHWEQVQQEYIEKYGHDVHTATMAILKELMVSKRITTLLQAIRDISFDPNVTPTWEARICEFADCCVVPAGITTFDERIKDLCERYAYTQNSPVIKRLHNNATRIESFVTRDILGNLPKHELLRKIEQLQQVVVR